MAEAISGVAVALGLMRRACALLKAEGELATLCHLQSAIETLRRERPIGAGEELEDEMAALVAGISL